MTPEAFARWQQHLNKFRLQNSLVCDLFLEDPTVYIGGKVDLEKTTPDTDEHCFDPAEDKFQMDWSLPMKPDYMVLFADAVITWFENRVALGNPDRANRCRPDQNMWRSIRNSVCFWGQTCEFLKGQVGPAAWPTVLEAYQNGEMNGCINRLQRSCPKYLQRSAIVVIRELAEQKDRETESRATNEVRAAKEQVLKAQLEFFAKGLLADQQKIRTLEKANADIRRAHHRHKADWMVEQDAKCGVAIKNWMSKHSQVWTADKHNVSVNLVSNYVHQIADRLRIKSKDVLVLSILDFNAPGTRTSGIQARLLQQVSLINDMNADGNCCLVLLPDFAKPTSVLGLIDEIRLIEDRLLQLKQSPDLRFCVQFDKAQDHGRHGRHWVEGRLVTSAADKFVATICEKLEQGSVCIPTDSSNLWVAGSTLVWGAHVMGKQANRSNDVVFVEDLSPNALPNTAERRSPTKQEFCAQKGNPDYELLKAAINGMELASGKHAILLVDHSPYVGGKMMACRRLQKERNGDAVPIFMVALAADKVGAEYVTTRLAHGLASEWAAGTLNVPDDEKADDAPPPIPQGVLDMIPGSKLLAAGLAAIPWTIVVPTGGRLPIGPKHVKEWRAAPTDYADQFDTLLQGHKEFESLLTDLEKDTGLVTPPPPPGTTTPNVNDPPPPDTKTWPSITQLKEEHKVVTEVESVVSGVQLMQDDHGEIYAVWTGASQDIRTMPQHTHLGGFGGGAFKTKDQVEDGDMHVFLKLKDDRDFVEYESFNDTKEIKTGTVYAMFVDAEKNGHATFGLTFHTLAKKNGMEGWDLTRVKARGCLK